MRSFTALLLVSVTVTSIGTAQEIETPPPGQRHRLPRTFASHLLRDAPVFRGGWAHRAALARQTNHAVTGEVPVAVVNALFADSPTPFITETDIQNEIFTGPSVHGTVYDHWREGSGNRFSFMGTSLPWVRTGISLDSAAGSGFGLGSDARTGDFLLQALAINDSTVDFGQFDNDGPDNVPNSGDDDGKVDIVAFHFAEIAASCGTNAIWPHRWVIAGWNNGAPYTTNDMDPSGNPIVIDDYIIQSAVTCDGQELARSTVIAHELGHVLGLPDYYDSSDGIQPEERRWVMGCWSLMAAGAWGCGTVDRNSVDKATHLGPWEKDLLGWLGSIEEVGPVIDSTFTISPVLASEHILKIPIRGDEEFLFIEQRAQTGFDVALPGAGVLVYHIEPARSRRPCQAGQGPGDCDRIYQVALVEADGDSALVKMGPQGGDRGVAGDAFQTGDRLSSATIPSIKRNDRFASGIIIHSMVVTATDATLTITTNLPPLNNLLEPFHNNGATPLTADEISFLDKYGNQNGSYDVGDLRALLKENPSVVIP